MALTARISPLRNGVRAQARVCHERLARSTCSEKSPSSKLTSTVQPAVGGLRGLPAVTVAARAHRRQSHVFFGYECGTGIGRRAGGHTAQLHWPWPSGTLLRRSARSYSTSTGVVCCHVNPKVGMLRVCAPKPEIAQW